MLLQNTTQIHVHDGGATLSLSPEMVFAELERKRKQVERAPTSIQNHHRHPFQLDHNPTRDTKTVACDFGNNMPQRLRIHI